MTAPNMPPPIHIPMVVRRCGMDTVNPFPRKEETAAQDQKVRKSGSKSAEETTFSGGAGEEKTSQSTG